MKTEYLIVSQLKNGSMIENTSALCETVNALCENGWVPCGGVFVDQDYLLQALTRPIDE